jgi:hypothetical protein
MAVIIAKLKVSMLDMFIIRLDWEMPDRQHPTSVVHKPYVSQCVYASILIVRMSVELLLKKES